MTHQAHLQRKGNEENGSFWAKANRVHKFLKKKKKKRPRTLKWSSRSLPTAYGAPITTSDTYWWEKKTAGAQLFSCPNWADEEEMLKGERVCSLVRQQPLELTAGHSNCATVCFRESSLFGTPSERAVRETCWQQTRSLLLSLHRLCLSSPDRPGHSASSRGCSWLDSSSPCTDSLPAETWNRLFTTSAINCTMK